MEVVAVVFNGAELVGCKVTVPILNDVESARKTTLLVMLSVEVGFANMVEKAASDVVIVELPAVLLGNDDGAGRPEAIGAGVEVSLARVDEVNTSVDEGTEVLMSSSVESVKSALVVSAKVTLVVSKVERGMINRDDIAEVTEEESEAPVSTSEVVLEIAMTATS